MKEIRRNIFKTLITFVLVVFINLNITSVSYAISTLDACAAKPSCAAAFGTSTTTKLKLVQSGNSTVNNIVKFRRRNILTGQIIEVVEKNFPAFSGVVAGIFGSGIAIKLASLSSEDVDQLRKTAYDQYCSNNIQSSYCTVGLLIVAAGAPIVDFTIDSNTKITLFYDQFNPSSVTYSQHPIDTRYPPDLSGFLDFYINDNGRWLLGNVDSSYDWDSIPENIRENIIEGYISDNQISESIKNNIQEVSSDLIPQDNEVIEFLPEVVTDGNLVYPNSDWIPMLETNTDFSSETDGNIQSETDGNIQSETDENTQSETDKNTQSETELDIPDIEVIEPKKFNARNFLQHGIEVFSNKFPFDILGDLDVTNISQDCPSYTFFDRVFELCPIRDLLVILKYPIIISFLIWSFQNI